MYRTRDDVRSSINNLWGIWSAEITVGDINGWHSDIQASDHCRLVELNSWGEETVNKEAGMHFLLWFKEVR